MEFKRRMGDVERVFVTYNFESRWEISTLSMNLETAWITQIGHTFVFFATNVASECDPLLNGCQWMVMEFSFQGGR